MSWLTLNGIELAAIAGNANKPKGPRRDIGDASAASDGSMRITRQTRKRDVTLESVPLTGAEAFAWESLITGAGHVWSFDVSVYSSKGLPGAAEAAELELQDIHTKYGEKALRVAADEEWTAALPSTTGDFASGRPWTVSAWRKRMSVVDTYVCIGRLESTAGGGGSGIAIVFDGDLAAQIGVGEFVRVAGRVCEVLSTTNFIGNLWYLQLAEPGGGLELEPCAYFTTAIGSMERDTSVVSVILDEPSPLFTAALGPPGVVSYGPLDATDPDFPGGEDQMVEGVDSDTEWSFGQDGANDTATEGYWFAIEVVDLDLLTLGPWEHLVVREGGAKWVDGVRNDAVTGPLPLVTDAELSLPAEAGADVFWDDVAACPYAWLDDWPAQVYASNTAFGLAPFLVASGKLVPEATTRQMVGKCSEGEVLQGGSGGELQNDLRRLTIELLER